MVVSPSSQLPTNYYATELGKNNDQFGALISDEVNQNTVDAIKNVSNKAKEADPAALELLTNLAMGNNEVGYRAACALLSLDQSGDKQTQESVRKRAYQVVTTMGKASQKDDAALFKEFDQSNPLVQLAASYAHQNDLHTEFSVKTSPAFESILAGKLPTSERFITDDEILAAIQQMPVNPHMKIHTPAETTALLSDQFTEQNPDWTICHIYPYNHDGHWLLVAHDPAHNQLVIFNSLKVHVINDDTMKQLSTTFGVERDKIAHLNDQGLQNPGEDAHNMPNDCGLLISDAMRYLSEHLAEGNDAKTVLNEYILGCQKDYGDYNTDTPLTLKQQKARKTLHTEGRLLLLALLGLDKYYTRSDAPHNTTPQPPALTCRQQAALASNRW